MTMVRMWREIPNDQKYSSEYADDPPPKGRGQCEAAVSLYEGDDHPEEYRRCRIPTAPGADLCAIHGGPKVPREPERERLLRVTTEKRDRALERARREATLVDELNEAVAALGGTVKPLAEP